MFCASICWDSVFNYDDGGALPQLFIYILYGEVQAVGKLTGVLDPLTKSSRMLLSRSQLSITYHIVLG